MIIVRNCEQIVASGFFVNFVAFCYYKGRSFKIWWTRLATFYAFKIHPSANYSQFMGQTVYV